jgi:pimeloyl-ACP methyl ester carboxylesterase
LIAGVRSISLTASGLEFTALEAGNPSDPLVLCLHGFPDGPQTFRHQFGPLVEAGYRVIAPTLRGYEPSSQPSDGDYSLTSLADDVVGWLDDLGADKAHLVGHDWGAAIVSVVGGLHSGRVATTTAMAVPPLPRIPKALRHVPRQLQRSWYMTVFQLRGVSERALMARDWSLLRRLWKAWSPSYEMSASEWGELRTQFKQPDVAKAALSYYRQNATPPILMGLRRTPAMEVTKFEVPTLVIHGSEDGCMDRRLFAHTVHDEDHPAGVRLLEIQGAGHFVHLEQPEQVNAAIVQHLAI